MKAVVNGAVLKCSFGAAPSGLSILPVKMVNAQNLPQATIMDNIAGVNILPFGMCSSLSNPAVAAATAAALGVLTPQPCMPVIVAPWAPGSQIVKIRKIPALTQSCKLMCAWAGVIEIIDPMQMVENVNK
ncbi:MAG: DUF4280 domain-containing protein [Francisellaceae bacterium]